MATTGRIRGTGGTNIAAGGNAWANAGNVSGAADGDYANASCAFPADASDNIATTVAATPIGGTIMSVTVGCTIRTDVAPVGGAYSVTVSLRNSAGTQLCHATFNTGLSTTDADLEGRAGLIGGATYAQIKTAVEAGIAAAAGPKGLCVSVSNLDGSTVDFRLSEVWLSIEYAKGPIYQDALPSAVSARTILVDVVNP